MQPLPGPDPLPWCPGPQGRLAGGRGEPWAACCLPARAGKGFGSPAAPHTCPHPDEGGQASVLAGMRRARPNVASPGAQTWPAGRVRAAPCIRLGVPRGGAAGLHRGLARAAWPCRRVGGVDDVPGVTEQWDSRSSPWEREGWVGRGGRSWRSGAVTVLVTQSRQAAERRTPGNRCSGSAPQGCGPGCHSGGILCPCTWLCPRHQGGRAGPGAGSQEGDDAGRHMGCPTRR